jgi:hypothetical protein
MLRKVFKETNHFLYFISQTQRRYSMAETAIKSKVKDEAQEHSEGVVARNIEEQTAKLPSDVFLWAAVGAMGASLCFELTGNSDKSRFFGQWVAPFLLFGVYNKLVKVAGSDRLHS